MEVIRLASCINPASGLIYMVTVEVMETGVGVSLQSSPEVLQVLSWMFALAVFRNANQMAGGVSSPPCQSSRTSVKRRPVLVLPLPGASTGYGRVVGIAACGQQSRDSKSHPQAG
jgi:hypothetical protein